MISKDSTKLNAKAIFRMNRRSFLKMAGVATGVAAGAFAFSGTRSSALVPPLTNCGIIEAFPTSPFIVSPFTDPLPQPTAYKPGWRRADGTLVNPGDPDEADMWKVRYSKYLRSPSNPTGAGVCHPGPDEHKQDCYGHCLPGETEKNYQGEVQTAAVEHRGTHEVWPVPGVGPNAANFERLINWPAEGVEPIYYHIRYKLGLHKFTTSKVRPIDVNGNPITPPPESGIVLDADGLATLPDSVIFGFNGTFPGPMLNLEYGKPVCIRMENDLDINPPAGSPPGTPALDLQDFGAPDRAVLTHQHNGHNAPECDGQPHYMQINDGGYTPGDWYDNLYLMYPAGGDPSEIQSFLWFHDHRMHYTGANVYKGQVGLTPEYDPGIPDDAGGIVPGTGLDPGDETKGLRLPGVRVDHGDGTFDVKYDIPMALYDCALDDGVTPHADMHTDPLVCGNTHPEWWGKLFFMHFPNHGFVGDIFTVNCTAYPVLHVLKRRYRFRFLGASIARIYELALMTSAAGPVAKPGTQGQWQIPDGVQWKPWTWIASMGGLLPEALVSDTCFVWPASRREFEVDFTNEPTGKVIYITNVVEMPNGRKPNFDPGTPVNARAYKVPLVKIIVDGDPLPEPDNSVPVIDPVTGTARELRPMPKLENGAGAPITLASTANLPHKEFVLSRSGSLGEESSWRINDLPFDGLAPLTTVVRDHPEVWTNRNGGGGWVHPMHMHMEEHTILARVGSTLPIHPEDAGKEDLTNLEPSEAVTFYRNFRTFTGRYVAHCHNLAHEDHNMMFGFTILDVPPTETSAISGTVTDTAGAPLAGVTVTLDGDAAKTATTDASGNYSLAGVADGSHTVTPSLAGKRFIPRSRNVTVKGASLTARNFKGVA